MTVKQLIDNLSGMPEDLEVRFAYGSGDYWKTTLAGKIHHVEEGVVKFSEYHSKDQVVDSDDERELEEVGVKQVVLLT